jgi:hypothetical protein
MVKLALLKEDTKVLQNGRKSTGQPKPMVPEQVTRHEETKIKL